MGGCVHSCMSSMLQAYLISFPVTTLYYAYRGMLELDDASCRTWPSLVFMSAWCLWCVACITGFVFTRALIPLTVFGSVSLMCIPFRCSGTLTSLVKFALLVMFWNTINP